jgi:lipid A ethanolaminephosphotransferase
MTCSSWLFNLIFSVVLVTIYNAPLWRYMQGLYPLHEQGSVLFLSLFFIVLVSFNYLCMTIFSFLKIEKYVSIIVLICSSAVLYFMNSHAILIDATMIENVLQTDLHETTELLSVSLFAYIIIMGLLPSLFIYKLNIKYPNSASSYGKQFASLLIPFIMVGVIALTQYQDFASFSRNNREFRYYILPNNYVNATYKTIKSHVKFIKNEKIKAVNAQQDSKWKTHSKKTLFVFVVGETARANNFSLNGYERQTNPLLEKMDIINFTKTYSCGTATAISLPCMFFDGGKDEYDSSMKINPNNLFQVVNRAGVPSTWVDNNSGCKGLCDGLPTINVADLENKYKNNENKSEVYDTVMIDEIDHILEKNKNNNFIVLHQKGSHGPAYYLRTPKEFYKFKPICETQELTKCDQESIRNSYDNTIYYTDYFLANLINKLKSLSADYNVAMIYVSDHGESLGENNLYLHGLPYMIAPEYQKHVPFLMWLSDGFAQQQHIDKNCVSHKKDNALSHDNIYHTILDGLDIQTSLKKENLSIFKGCKSL